MNSSLTTPISQKVLKNAIFEENIFHTRRVYIRKTTVNVYTHDFYWIYVRKVEHTRKS